MLCNANNKIPGIFPGIFGDTEKEMSQWAHYIVRARSSIRYGESSGGLKESTSGDFSTTIK
jgi:hypothetical protein